MKKNALSNWLRRTAALVLAAALAIPTVYAAAGEPLLQTSIELVDGLDYHNTITVNNDSRVESFSLVRDEDSDAYAKGIRVDDVLTAINGIHISNVEEYESQLYTLEVGDLITVSIYRDGRLYEVQLTVEEAGA